MRCHDRGTMAAGGPKTVSGRDDSRGPKPWTGLDVEGRPDCSMRSYSPRCDLAHPGAIFLTPVRSSSPRCDLARPGAILLASVRSCSPRWHLARLGALRSGHLANGSAAKLRRRDIPSRSAATSYDLTSRQFQPLVGQCSGIRGDIVSRGRSFSLRGELFARR